MAEISKIKLPSGNIYDIKDAVAREAVGGGLQFRGITTTALTDGATTTTYRISSETTDRTAVNADMVVYGNKEFIFTTSDNKWHELGDNSDLGDLAYKDEASGTYNMVQSITVSTNSTTNTTAAVTSTTIDANNPKTYTPSGTITAPTISVATSGTTEIIKNPTSVTVAKTVVAAAPGETAPSNPVIYYSVANETLSLYQLGYTTGDSITTNNVTVKTGDASYSSSQPVFTGDDARLVTGNIAIPATYSASITEENRTVTVR